MVKEIHVRRQMDFDKTSVGLSFPVSIPVTEKGSLNYSHPPTCGSDRVKTKENINNVEFSGSLTTDKLNLQSPQFTRN